MIPSTWTVARARRLAGDITSAGVAATVREHGNEFYLEVVAPPGASEPVDRISLWHDGDEWRLDSLSVDTTTFFGQVEIITEAELTDAHIVALLWLGALQSEEVYADRLARDR